jgi:hypothetical protein
MARKQATERNTDMSDIREELQTTAELRGEIAQEAYDYQDDEMKKVIDRIVTRLREASTGYVDVQVNPPSGTVVPVKLEAKYVHFNLLYVATEIVKDLAMFDVRIASYKFPPSLCVACGAELTNQTKNKRRRG